MLCRVIRHILYSSMNGVSFFYAMVRSKLLYNLSQPKKLIHKLRFHFDSYITNYAQLELTISAMLRNFERLQEKQINLRLII